MFGYIQPLKCELKMKEYDYYRAAYCGLCNSLRSRCGVFARFIVNYDFVFIALLLSHSGKSGEQISKKRCLVCPKGRMCVQSAIYDKTAEISVILTYLKLCDDVNDNGFWKALFKARIPKFFLSGAYKRASLALPEYKEKSIKLYKELCRLEDEKCPSIDETADKFALMLSLIAEEDNSNSRILKELFYHIGRFVYIIDALDDFSKDMKKGEYNPIASRFGLCEEVIPLDVKQRIFTTLEDSKQAVLRALNLLDKSDNEGIIRNIVEFGMSASVTRIVEKEKENERSV